MERFYKHTNENTIPLIIYLVTGFISVFILNIYFLLVIYGLFLINSAIIFNKRILLKTFVISICIVPLIIFLSMLLSWEFTIKQITEILPKSISFSIMISSSVAFFVFLPAYQLFRISKTILQNNYPAYALLAGFRTFPVFFQYSKRIFMAIKIRNASSSLIVLLFLYLQNIFIMFINYLEDFIIRFSFLNLHLIKVKSSFNYKTLLLIVYLIISITLIVYERIGKI